MRKFKNIITGHIAIQTNREDQYTTGDFIIPAVFIQNSNDWEEIIEKDYEILKFRSNVPNSDESWDWLQSSKDLWQRRGKITTPVFTDWLLNNPQYLIYSVKRLSDSEVFTIGDKCNLDVTITGFEIVENRIRVFTGKKGDWQWLNSIEKIKQPLFTTHDGVEITDPEQYVYQVTDYHLSHDMKLHRKKASNVYKNNNVKQFYSEESAKRYLLENRNLLSYNDVMSLFVNNVVGENTRILNSVGVFDKKLLNLLKDKIK